MLSNLLIIIDEVKLSRDDVERVHFIYALASELNVNTELLLLGNAVLMLNPKQIGFELVQSFAKKLNAAELFGVSQVYALKEDLNKFKMKKTIPIRQLKDAKNFLKSYDKIIKI